MKPRTRQPNPMTAIEMPEQRALFVVVPKAAASSIKVAIYEATHHTEVGPDFQPNAVLISQFTDARNKRYRGWLRFAVVRNPFDRLVSCWYEKIARRAIVFAGFKAYGWDVDMPFGAFVEAACALPRECMDHHFRPQVDLLEYDGEWCVDFLMRFETLAADWARLRLKLPCLGPLSYRNKREHEPYRTYYTRDLWERVCHAYRDDIVRFGYEADRP